MYFVGMMDKFFDCLNVTFMNKDGKDRSCSNNHTEIKHDFRLKVYKNNKKSFFLIMKEHFLPYLAEWEWSVSHEQSWIQESQETLSGI